MSIGLRLSDAGCTYTVLAQAGVIRESSQRLVPVVGSYLALESQFMEVVEHSDGAKR